MILDDSLQLSPLGGFTIDGNINFKISDVVPLEQARNIGDGQQLFMVFRVNEAIQVNIGTPRFAMWAWHGPAANGVGATILGSTQMFGSVVSPAVPQLNQKIVIAIPPIIPDPIVEAAGISTGNFLGAMFYNGTQTPVTDNYADGAFQIDIVQGLQSWRDYPAGFTVA